MMARGTPATNCVGVRYAARWPCLGFGREAITPSNRWLDLLAQAQALRIKVEGAGGVEAQPHLGIHPVIVFAEFAQGQ